MCSSPGELGLFLTFVPGKLEAISPDFVRKNALVHQLAVDEGGSAEPTRDENIIGMYAQEGVQPPPPV